MNEYGEEELTRDSYPYPNVAGYAMCRSCQSVTRRDKIRRCIVCGDSQFHPMGGLPPASLYDVLQEANRGRVVNSHTTNFMSYCGCCGEAFDDHRRHCGECHNPIMVYATDTMIRRRDSSPTSQESDLVRFIGVVQGLLHAKVIMHPFITEIRRGSSSTVTPAHPMMQESSIRRFLNKRAKL
jgi:hypothetical protein